MPINFQIPMSNVAELTTGNRTGICMAISCFWIQRCRQLAGVPGAMDPLFTNWQYYETMGIAFETLLADHTAQFGGNATITSQQTLQTNALGWHDIFFHQMGLPSMEVYWGTAETMDYLLSLMEGGGQRGYIFTGYRSVNTHGGGLQLQSGHTVAFWYSTPGTVKTFMDPNFGQYTVQRVAPWAASIEQHLLGTYLNYNQWVLIGIG